MRLYKIILKGKIVRMKKIDSLNLVPFIDIVLVLLVIVLVSASFLPTNTLEVHIPSVKQNTTSSVNADDVIITIDKNGKFMLNNKELNLESLKLELSKITKDSSIVINGDKKSEFEGFVALMEMLQNMGYENLFILVKNKGEK